RQGPAPGTDPRVRRGVGRRRRPRDPRPAGGVPRRLETGGRRDVRGREGGARRPDRQTEVTPFQGDGTMRTRTILAAALLAAGALLGGLTFPTAGQGKKPEPGAKAEPLTPAQLAERTLHRRAVEAVVWGMPAVNFELLCQAMVKAKGEFNQIVYWSRLPDWKNQTLTPTPDTIYVFPFFNTKDAGPMVLEIPPAGEGGSITGSIDDAWQCALEDVGPAGGDKGKGGKYLILPRG